jgi:hypothetical protein
MLMKINNPIFYILCYQQPTWHILYLTEGKVESRCFRDRILVVTYSLGPADTTFFTVQVAATQEDNRHGLNAVVLRLLGFRSLKN